MPSVSEFRSSLERHGGVQRQYRWRVNFAFPVTVATSDEARDASLHAITTATPKSVLGEVLVPFGGREMPIPGDRKFEPLTVTFIGVEDDVAHTLFERWSEQFNGTESNTAVGEFADLYQDVTMDLLDKQDNVIKTYRLQDAWPQEVGELTLDQTAQDTYQQFSVILRFFQSSNPSSR